MTQAINLIDSAFDSQGAQFGSAIPWLDSNKLRVHQVFGGENFEHKLEKGSNIQILQWISFKRTVSKQHNRTGESNSSVVAVGTNKGSILIYSPKDNKVVAVLSGKHVAPVTSISQLENQPSKLWSCDFSGSIVEWDLMKQTAVRQFQSPEPDTRVIKVVSKDRILVASTNIYLIDSSDPSESLQSFAGFVHPVSNIIISNTNSDVFICYSSDRSISVMSISQNKTINLLIAQANIDSVILAQDDSYLAATTENGTVELFVDPLVLGLSAKLENSSSNSVQSKKRQKSKSSVVSKKSDGEVKLVRPGKFKTTIKIQNVFFNASAITLASLENGSIPVFDTIPFKSDSGQLLQTDFTIEKPYKLVSNEKTSVDPAAVISYNESNTVISSGKDVHSLDDQAEDEEDEEEPTLAERLDALEVEIGQDGYASSDIPKLNGSSHKSLTNELSTPGSFATLLAQALKTNDHALLETCFSTREDSLIKTSIQRLDSTLAVKLLERLAERMARTPVRAGELNVWIKWVMITHGAYLVTVPNLLKTLSSLHSILSERVSILPKLLALQGRLQLLSSQIELRRDLAPSPKDFEDGDGDEDSSDDDYDNEINYVEDGAIIANGEESFYDDEDDDEENDGFIELEAEESDDSEQFDDEDMAGFSDIEEENIDAMSEDDEDNYEEDPVPVKTKSKKTNGKF